MSALFGGISCKDTAGEVPAVTSQPQPVQKDLNSDPAPSPVDPIKDERRKKLDKIASLKENRIELESRRLELETQRTQIDTKVQELVATNNQSGGSIGSIFGTIGGVLGGGTDAEKAAAVLDIIGKLISSNSSSASKQVLESLEKDRIYVQTEIDKIHSRLSYISDQIDRIQKELEELDKNP